ncbi:hypothetical protein Ciccas_007059 [Cichlidogyrus casuarinus]|uniref:Uncharacterized protein n=1 Tax=Cichlidogyrus casuarinus TaxID=1844966 RepID=A0ABD2Q4M1_9PLAT
MTALNPADIKALFRRATSYEKLEKYKDSMQDVRRLLSIDSSNQQAQQLARTVEAKVQSLVTKSESLSGRINSMFDVIKSKSDKLNTGISNLIALLNEEVRAAPDLIWNHPDFPIIYELCSGEAETVQLAQSLLGKIVSQCPNKGKTILSALTPRYFIANIYSQNVRLAEQSVVFLGLILESLTQLKSYHDAKEVYAKKHQNLVTPRPFHNYQLQPDVAKEVTEILSQTIKAVNSYRLKAQVRDALLELLIQVIPKETGIAWANKFVQLPGAVDRLLDIASAVAQSALSIKLAKLVLNKAFKILKQSRSLFSHEKPKCFR